MNMLNRIISWIKPTPPTEPEPPFDAYDYISIPRESREKFAKLVDTVLADKSDGRLTKFRLWDFVDTILPNIGLGWSVIWLSATQPALRRLKSDAPKLASPAAPAEQAPTVELASVSISKEAGNSDIVVTAS